FASLDALIARQGGQHVLYGSALALAAALQAWSRHAGTPSSIGAYRHSLKPIRSQPSVASVATMAGIRPSCRWSHGSVVIGSMVRIRSGPPPGVRSRQVPYPPGGPSRPAGVKENPVCPGGPGPARLPCFLGWGRAQPWATACPWLSVTVRHQVVLGFAAAAAARSRASHGSPGPRAP